MKLAYIIARENIISMYTKELHDDMGLSALNGIIRGNPRLFDDAIDNQEIEQSLRNEFEASHPGFRVGSYQLVIDGDAKSTELEFSIF